MTLSATVRSNFIRQLGSVLYSAFASTTAPEDGAREMLEGASGPPVASVALLQAVTPNQRFDGQVRHIAGAAIPQTGRWRFVASGTAADTSNNLVITPTIGTGVWVRETGQVTLSLPVTYVTADAAVLFTCPVGARFHPREAWWDVSTTFAGGSSSAIGVAGSVSGWSTAGDILGGASGDVAAGLVSTNTRMQGTIGAKVTTRTLGRWIMIAADTLTFNRITSVFTSGAANVRVLGDLIQNDGL